MPAVKIEDRFLAKEFDGTRIGNVSTRRHGIPRWADLEVYKMDDGSGWLIHRTGMSTVYHTAGTSCRTASGEQRGQPATTADLPDNPVSCGQCEPPWPEDLEADEVLRFEFPRHSFDTFTSPGDVVTFLTTIYNRRTRHTATVMSEPVTELLRQCRLNDPDFASAPRPVERITPARRTATG